MTDKIKPNDIFLQVNANGTLKAETYEENGVEKNALLGPAGGQFRWDDDKNAWVGGSGGKYQLRSTESGRVMRPVEDCEPQSEQEQAFRREGRTAVEELVAIGLARLISGGPKLTVVGKGPTGCVECNWFNRAGELESRHFPADQLVALKLVSVGNATMELCAAEYDILEAAVAEANRQGLTTLNFLGREIQLANPKVSKSAPTAW